MDEPYPLERGPEFGGMYASIHGTNCGPYARMYLEWSQDTESIIVVKKFNRLIASHEWARRKRDIEREVELLTLVQNGPHIIEAGPARCLDSPTLSIEMPMKYYAGNVYGLMVLTGDKRGLRGGLFQVPPWYNTVLTQMLEALEFLHGENINIIHRGIAAQNVLYNDTDHFVLSEFGHARRARPPPHGHAGTPDYMPPEMFDDTPQTTAVDMWSLGVLCMEMIGGLPKTTGYNFEEMKPTGWCTLVDGLAKLMDKPEIEAMVRLDALHRSSASELLKLLSISSTTLVQALKPTWYHVYSMVKAVFVSSKSDDELDELTTRLVQADDCSHRCSKVVLGPENKVSIGAEGKVSMGAQRKASIGAQRKASMRAKSNMGMSSLQQSPIPLPPEARGLRLWSPRTQRSKRPMETPSDETLNPRPSQSQDASTQSTTASTRRPAGSQDEKSSSRAATAARPTRPREEAASSGALMTSERLQSQEEAAPSWTASAPPLSLSREDEASSRAHLTQSHTGRSSEAATTRTAAPRPTVPQTQQTQTCRPSSKAGIKQTPSRPSKAVDSQTPAPSQESERSSSTAATQKPAHLQGTSTSSRIVGTPTRSSSETIQRPIATGALPASEGTAGKGKQAGRSRSAPVHRPSGHQSPEGVQRPKAQDKQPTRQAAGMTQQHEGARAGRPSGK